jgi:hypothetical protein
MVMSALVGSLKKWDALWMGPAIGFAFLVIAATCVPNLLRSRNAAEHVDRDKLALQAYVGSNSLEKSDTSAAAVLPPSQPSQNSLLDRKMVRTSSLEMTVKNPLETADKVRAFAESLGGYVESSQISAENASSATMTIRVPAAKLEVAKAELHKYALRVDSEKTDAEDVTKQYVDMDARLRNLRAEETQYLTIMKSATKVQDMLDVSEKLSGVRGEIEQQQAEFTALSKQVETVAITISLRAQAETDVLGFHWRPLYQLKLAAHDALDGLANYASTMAAVLLYLPVVLLWGLTGLLGAFAAWRVLRWAGRVLFGWKPAVVTAR